MRRRFQNGSLLQRGGSWVAQWWEDGHRRKRFLGLVAEMSKTTARPRRIATVTIQMCAAYVAQQHGISLSTTFKKIPAEIGDVWLMVAEIRTTRRWGEAGR